MLANSKFNRIAFSRPIQFLIFGVLLVISLILISHGSQSRRVRDMADKWLEMMKAGKGRFLPEPRFVFIDLGANDGDTCRAFYQLPSATFNMSYPKPEGKDYKDAEVFLFEANPSFNNHLINLKQELSLQGYKVNIFPSTPVWTEEKVMPFFLDKRDDHAAGSSLDPVHPDPVKTGNHYVNLTTISVAHFIMQNFLPQDFVVVKMDIEITEYSIVPHLAKMQTWTLIDHLLIEFHAWLIPQEDPRVQQMEDACTLMEEHGVHVPRDYSTNSKRR